MKKPKISIGIPAYNEEANILGLIAALLQQKQYNWQLVEILVFSDGSTDETATLAKSLKNSCLKVFEYPNRSGQQAMQNKMIKKFKGDILIIVEADTLPQGKTTIEELIKPYLTNQSRNLGMVVGRDIATAPTNFFEKIVYAWSEIKQKAFAEHFGGINLYNCSGHTMRALSREFAHKLYFPNDAPEDCYCYLRLRQLGLGMVRNKNARVLSKTISTMSDRITHSKKFYYGKRILYKYFDKSFIESEYRVPKSLFLKHIASSFRVRPFFTALALLEFSANFCRFSYSYLRLDLLLKKQSLI